MKVTFGSGTPIEVLSGELRIQEGCVVMMEHGIGGNSLVVAYRLREGEFVRKTGKEEYHVEL